MRQVYHRRRHPVRVVEAVEPTKQPVDALSGQRVVVVGAIDDIVGASVRHEDVVNEPIGIGDSRHDVCPEAVQHAHSVEAVFTVNGLDVPNQIFEALAAK
jgi:hypothetical protein